MAVSLRQLKALVAVVDEGTFTDAAIALGTTQASVSRAVAALEEELGRPMLIRNTRQASLSAAGSRVVRLAREALDAVAAIEGIDHNTADLRVGYTWSALGEHTAVIQQHWSARHPGHTLNFVLSSTPTAGLAAGLADLAVIRHQLDDPRFETVVIGTEQRYAVLARTDPLANRRQLRLTDFADRIVARNSQVGSTGPQLWTTAGRRPAGFHEVPSVEDYLTVIAAGQAIGVTSAATREQHQRLGVVYRRLVDAPPIEVHLAWWKGDPPAETQALIRLIRDAYAGRLTITE